MLLEDDVAIYICISIGTGADFVPVHYNYDINCAYLILTVINHI